MNRPHSREKRIVNKTVKVVKKDINNDQNKIRKPSFLERLLGVNKK